MPNPSVAVLSPVERAVLLVLREAGREQLDAATVSERSGVGGSAVRAALARRGPEGSRGAAPLVQYQLVKPGPDRPERRCYRLTRAGRALADEVARA
jgi:hypothetical protein